MRVTEDFMKGTALYASTEIHIKTDPCNLVARN